MNIITIIIIYEIKMGADHARLGQNDKSINASVELSLKTKQQYRFFMFAR